MLHTRQCESHSTAMSRKKTRAITTFKEHSERVSSVVFSPDGQLIASASYDETVKLWNPKTSQVIRTFLVPTTDENHNQEYKLWIEASSKLSFSQDGKFLTLGNGYNALITWQVDTGKVVKKIRGRHSYTSATAFSPDGTYFANSLNNIPSNVDLTKLSTDQIIHRLTQSTYSQESGEIGIWDVKTGQQISTIPKTGLSSSMVFSSDNQFLVNDSLNATINLWDVKSRELLRVWEGYGSVAISPNNEFVAVNNYGCVKVWNRKTGKEIYSLEGERDGEALVFSPNSQILASTGLNTITIWDLMRGQKIITLSSPQIFTIAISLNGKLIASGNFDNTVRVWKMQ